MLITPEGTRSFFKKGECTLTIKGRNSCEIIERGRITEKAITVLHYAINVPNVQAAVVIDTNNQLTIGRVAYLTEFNPFIEAVKKVTFYKLWDENMFARCMRDLDDYHVHDGNYKLSSDRVNEVVLIYPASGVNLVTLHDEDLERLKEGEFLNDSLIEFYIRFASSTHAADRNDFHCFNTFFYQQLTSKGDLQKKLTMEEAFSRVKRWTKKVNIFTRKFLIIPINERLHWYLAVVWNPGAYLKEEVSAGEDTEMVDAESSTDSPKSSSDECKIFIFDSLDGRHPQVPKTVGAYLKYEAQEKLNREVVAGGVPKVHYAKVQSQLNHCDCGIFLLHYLNLMLRMPDVVAKAVINNEPLNTSEYGTLHEIRNMRYFMKDTIDELKAGALLAS
ncbi:hypothetical protein BJ741DRAFT_268476 [Chytriomyces cf. hyalinus JEL632]|nr:hypothetical protein BJ741DRAFT_268476 [Chytriomyces cf. hyalinus JEL632]